MMRDIMKAIPIDLPDRGTGTAVESTYGADISSTALNRIGTGPKKDTSSDSPFAKYSETSLTLRS